MSLQAQFLLFFSAGALCTDLFLQKIPNLWILFGIFLGLFYQSLQHNFFGVFFSFTNFFIPVFILFPLFFFHMMGAGDIKLLGTLCIFLNFSDVISLIIFSFLIGALLSCFLFFYPSYLSKRFSYFFSYVSKSVRYKQIFPYMKPGNRSEHFPFAVPVFLATMLYTGGFHL